MKTTPFKMVFIIREKFETKRQENPEPAQHPATPLLLRVYQTVVAQFAERTSGDGQERIKSFIKNNKVDIVKTNYLFPFTRSR